jgi:hypothetical protein
MEVICRQSSTRDIFPLEKAVREWASMFNREFPHFQLTWMVRPSTFHKLKLSLKILYPRKCLAALKFTSILRENGNIAKFVYQLNDLTQMCQIHVRKCNKCKKLSRD